MTTVESAPALVVGVTGGIGSGKTAATDEFARLGVTVIDADQLSRDVVQAGTTPLQEIAEHFGQHLIQPDGQLDRRALRQIVFNDAAARQWLEELLHPLIRQRIVEALQHSAVPYTILVSPLLLETDQHKLCDRILLIDAPESLQISRTAERDKTTDEAVKAIMNNQMSRQQRLAMADDIVCNDAGLDTLHQAVRRLHQQYLGMLPEELQA